MEQLYIILGSLAAFIVAVRVYHGSRSVFRLPLPPGPKRLPFLGNLLQMPTTLEWVTFEKWSRDLDTSILYLNVAGTSLIVLNTLEAANDLLEKRSSIYSNRPRMPMLIELMGNDFQVATMPYGERWRQCRRLIHHSFSPSASSRYLPHTLKAVRNLLGRFLDIPDDIMGNFRHMTGEAIISIAYGLDVQPRNDPYIALAEKSNEGASAAAVPGAFLVDTLPFLKYIPGWVPGAGFQREAKRWKKLARDLVEIPFAATKQNMHTGTCRPCFTSIGLQAMEDGIRDAASSEDNIKKAAATLYSVGADTTLAILGSCVLGLLDHPEVVKKAQSELDRVIRPGHLPDFDDEASLPYITAVVKESLRWRDAAPMGVPHVIDVEDEYRGYRIPAGSIVITNSWAMLHDEVAYPDPFTFNPDRFMKGDQLDPSVRDPSDACWGFGRRICPGRYMAFSAIWITIASLLTVYDIKKKIDEDGNIIEPGHDYVSTIVYAPKPYTGSITPRSKEAEMLIRSAGTYDTA